MAQLSVHLELGFRSAAIVCGTLFHVGGKHLCHLCKLCSLLDAQVQHDLLGATRHRHCTNLSADAFHLLTLTSTRVGKASEDLSCFTSTIFKHLGALDLAEGGCATQLQSCLHFVHGAELVR